MGYQILVKMVKAIVSYFFVSLEIHTDASVDCILKIDIWVTVVRVLMTVTHWFTCHITFSDKCLGN